MAGFANAAEKEYLFKLKSVTCRLDSGRYITASCMYLDGRGKGPCSITRIDETIPGDTVVTESELKSGKAHVARVGDKQYVTYSIKSNGATVCFGYGDDGPNTEIIITGELINKITYADLGKPELDQKK
jgi:hypothetical protein